MCVSDAERRAECVHPEPCLIGYVRSGAVESKGEPYRYISPGVVNPRSYDLISLGADGSEGGTGDGEDIVSW